VTQAERRGGGYLLDTSALAALPLSRQVSTLIVSAPRMRLPVFAPVTCIEAADRIRPGIARHVTRIPAIEPVSLTFGAVLDLRRQTPTLPLDVAHVISLGRPTEDRPAGLFIATLRPDLYAGFELRVYQLGE
jgi:hypothetical protein